MEVRWSQILKHFPQISLDLHEKFGVDIESGILRERTWMWLELRILDLVGRPTRLRESLGLPALPAGLFNPV